MDIFLLKFYLLIGLMAVGNYQSRKSVDYQTASTPLVLYLQAVYSFNVFSLVVELGSALGLWLGLSAINFYDFGNFLLKYISIIYLEF